MRLLIGLRHDVDLLDPSLLVDFAGETVFAGPLMRLPWSAFLREGILIVLAFEPERLIAPRKLQKAEDFFEGFTIDPIALALVAGGGADVNFLRHLIEPASLISAGETDQGAALGE